MKKIIMIVLIGLILILSSCSSMDIDEHNDYQTVQDLVSYNYGSMSFNNTSESNILYGLNDHYLDFKYTYNTLSNTELTLEEETAYQSLFVITERIEDELSIPLPVLLTKTSSEFNGYATRINVVLRIDDIVLFNTLKTVNIELKELSITTQVKITTIVYIELKLDISLTDSEIESLDLLQQKINELHQSSNDNFNISENLLDDLLALFVNYIEYVPTESELIELAVAYDLVLSVFND